MLDDAAAAVGAGSIIPLTGKDRTPTALPRPSFFTMSNSTPGADWARQRFFGDPVSR
jgi:hypothetical protein